jgi:hypothetical protein
LQVILENAEFLNLFSQNSMGLQRHSFPLCFSSIGMFEDFLKAITQFNNVLLYIGRETIFEVSNLFSRLKEKSLSHGKESFVCLSVIRL